MNNVVEINIESYLKANECTDLFCPILINVDFHFPNITRDVTNAKTPG